MDGGNNQYSMDGSYEPERTDDWGSEGISPTVIDAITERIYERVKAEIQVETVKASREAFADLVTMLSLRKVVNEQRREKGWADQYEVNLVADKVRMEINNFFIRSNVANTFNIEGLAKDVGELMDFAGILDVEKFECRMEELNKNFKIVTDMIADPHLALSERVKSFQLK